MILKLYFEDNFSRIFKPIKAKFQKKQEILEKSFLGHSDPINVVLFKTVVEFLKNFFGFFKNICSRAR